MSPTALTILLFTLLLASSGALVATLVRNAGFRRQARDAQALLQDVVVAMPGGFVLWDQDDRLALFNKRFADLYERSAHLLVPGTRFEDIVRGGALLGQYPQAGDDIEGFVRDVVVRHQTGSGVFERLLPDGTWLRITERRTASGSIVGIRTDISDLKAAQARVEHLAQHDALTGLPNRPTLFDRLDTLLKSSAPGDVAALYLDLDEFKTVNDTFGHSVGDTLLQAVAGRLRGCLREYDLVARHGGDEFIVIVSDEDALARAEVLAARIIDAVGTPYVVDGHDVGVGVSVGVALSDGPDADGLLARADQALYVAKRAGRGTHRVWRAGVDALVA